MRIRHRHGTPARRRRLAMAGPRLSYANAAIAEAVIAAGRELGRDHLLQNGLRMLGWLLADESRNGHLSVVPAAGWGRGEDRPSFNDARIPMLDEQTGGR